MMSNEIHELTEEELKNIAGGDSPYYRHYVHVKRLIESGYDVEARNYYISYAAEISEQLKKLLRRHFKDKFGYPIE